EAPPERRGEALRIPGDDWNRPEVKRSIDIPKEVDFWLRQEARRQRRSVAQIIRDALLLYREQGDREAAVSALPQHRPGVPAGPGVEAVKAREARLLETPVGAAMAKVADQVQVSDEAREAMAIKVGEAMPLLALALAFLVPILGSLNLPDQAGEKK